MSSMGISFQEFKSFGRPSQLALRPGRCDSSFISTNDERMLPAGIFAGVAIGLAITARDAKCLPSGMNGSLAGISAAVRQFMARPRGGY